MSTSIDQIINSLQTNANEKKKQIHNSYSEKSMWLANEFALIKKLIQNNPRDNRIPLSETSCVEQGAAVVVSSSSGEARTSLDKKRKVPDTANTVKLSPEQKRASIDADDIISQAGLPSDLNKLTKEQLLKELKKLGRSEFTAKQVKKDLVDGLREALVEAHRAKQTPAPSAAAPVVGAASEGISVAVQDTATSEMVLSTPGKPASSVRRGSQMSDFRNLVAQQVTSVAPSTAAPAIESEFQARQNRHRESVARKSIVVAAPESAAPSAPAAVAPEPAAVPPAAPAEFTSQVLDKSSIYPEDGVWMEVSSPVKAPAGPAGGVACGDHTAEEMEATEQDESEPVAAEAEAVSVPTETAAPAEEDRQRSESDASFVSCLSAASAPKSAAAGTTKESATSATSARAGPASSAAPSASGPARSTSNLRAAAEGRAMMSTAASKPSVPVAPASQKAKMTSSSVQSVPSSTGAPAFKKKDPLPEVPTKSVVKPATHTAPTAAPAPAGSSSSSSAAGASAPAKKGIFGFLSNNKKPATAASTPAGTANPTAAPTPVPAMVDAIIKSHKADSATTGAAAPASVAPSTTIKASVPDASRVQTPPDVKEAIHQSQLSSASKVVATPLNNAFNSKSLISNIVNNYNNALKSGNNAVHGPGGSAAPVAASPAPVAPMPRPTPTAQASQPAVLRDITAASTAPASTPSAKPAAAPVPTPAPAESECQGYQIEDRASSDESGTDGEEEDEASRRRKAAMVPDWARGPQLKEALERQYGMHGEAPMDPDLIFPEVTTCSLEEIFGASANKANKLYSKRSSSAHWDADKMTLVEKRTYRKHMGYDRAPTVLHNHAHLQQVGGVAMPGAR